MLELRGKDSAGHSVFASLPYLYLTMLGPGCSARKASSLFARHHLTLVHSRSVQSSHRGNSEDSSSVAEDFIVWIGRRVNVKWEVFREVWEGKMEIYRRRWAGQWEGHPGRKWQSQITQDQ